MKRGSTPTHVIRTSIDLTQAKIYLTYSQNGHTLVEKTNEDLEVTDEGIVVMLTQEETLRFKAGVETEVQIRYVTSNGTADASNVIKVTVDDVLKNGVIK